MRSNTPGGATAAPRAPTTWAGASTTSWRRRASPGRSPAARWRASRAFPTTRPMSWTTPREQRRAGAGVVQGPGRHPPRLRHALGVHDAGAGLRIGPAVPADRLDDPVHAPARRGPGPGQHRPDQPGQLLLPAQVPVGAADRPLRLPAHRLPRPAPLVAAVRPAAGGGEPVRAGPDPTR